MTQSNFRDNCDYDDDDDGKVDDNDDDGDDDDDHIVANKLTSLLASN